MMIDAADRGGQAAEAVEELDEAARAFAALCAEVGLLRRAVAGLPDVVAERGPDYGPTLGALAQGLGRVEDGLQGIAAHPVLTLTAEQHARALGAGAAEVLRTAAAAVRTQSEALGAERQALSALVGRATTDRRQRRVRLGFGAAGLIAGLIAYPLAGSILPGGSYLAALATGTRDRWQAGAGLLGAADPSGAAMLSAASRLYTANTETVQACLETASRTGADQRCLIIVPVPQR